MSKTPFGRVLSANTSFVTSFPGLFEYPASENATLLKILEDKNQQPTKENLHQLFNDSIRTLNDNISTDSTTYSAVGLQELNNTEEVHHYVAGVAGSNTFFCNNVFEGSTFPTLGYIVNQPIQSFKEKRQEVVGKLFNTLDQNHIDVTDVKKCFSIGKESEKYMAIRDLGVIEDTQDNQDNQHDFVLAKSYTYKDKTQKVVNIITPDHGRPISMIICTKPKVIHINCQMVNPSVLKKFVKKDKKDNNNNNNNNNSDNNNSDIPPNYFDNAKNLLQETNCLNDKTLKTLSELAADDTLKLWVDYCKRRLEYTIPQLLSDFGIATVEGIQGYSWVLTGDLNDGFGYLRQKLSLVGINIFGMNIKFVFDETTTLKTCCPNTNSSKTESDTPLQTTITTQAISMPLTKTIQKQVEEMNIKIDDVNKIFNTANFIFEGDQVAFCIPETIIETILKPLQRNFSEMTSDHIFVMGTVKIQGVGGRKKTKKNKKNKKRIQKQTKKRKQKTNKNRKRKYKKSHKK